MVCSRTCVQFEHRSHVPTSSLNRSQELPISNLSFAYVFCSCLQCPLFHSLEYHFKSLIMFYKHLMNLLKNKTSHLGLNYFSQASSHQLVHDPSMRLNHLPGGNHLRFQAHGSLGLPSLKLT